MFDAIVPTYDLLNRIISLGMDGAWRKKALRVCLSDDPKNVIDLGTGTGDLALMLKKTALPGLNVIGADFSISMLRSARRRSERRGASLNLTAADAVDLPFASNSMDAVVTAFTLRNVPDLGGAFASAARVLKPRGTSGSAGYDADGLGTACAGLSALLPHRGSLDRQARKPPSIRVRIPSAFRGRVPVGARAGRLDFAVWI